MPCQITRGTAAAAQPRHRPSNTATTALTAAILTGHMTRARVTRRGRDSWWREGSSAGGGAGPGGAGLRAFPCEALVRAPALFHPTRFPEIPNPAKASRSTPRDTEPEDPRPRLEIISRRSRQQRCRQGRMQHHVDDTQAGAGPEAEQDEAPLLAQQPSCTGLCSTRCGLAVVLHISFFLAYTLRVSLSIAIIAMSNSSHPHSWSSSAPHSSDPGFAQDGVIFPAQYTLWAKWAPPLERSRLMNIADAGCTFGTFFALLVAGIICQSLGWPFVFYIFGGVGCAWCLCWFFLVHEDPAHHPWISAREQEYIVSSLAHQGSSHGRSLPLVAMAKSLPLWAITIACFCTDWLFYMLLTSMPMFMNNVLHFDLRENGFLSSLPYIGNGLGHILAGLLADFLLARRVLGTAAVRKLFSALGMLLPATFLVAVPYIGCSSTVVVVLLTLALTIMSMTGAGININHIDIAPRYAGFLLGITNTFGIVAGIIAPTTVGLLISQDLQTGWRNAFFLSAALNLFGLIFYIAFGSGTIQDWAREDAAGQ
ncbi:sodium-dependent phosphate transport protein 4-like isoform X2 [Falco biarmicus]|uniref:sodium-dependent phosphate transport protein 4-like isoform X2 n=1 Tax=Falco biarmicus TaxID=345155 RepID=UPI0024BCD6E3|nr:sodium-dependent phosphate transport protein 4-like isoform X2 [Falco biarmicus]